jgi:hypothetical protein
MKPSKSYRSKALARVSGVSPGAGKRCRVGPVPARGSLAYLR